MALKTVTLVADGTGKPNRQVELTPGTTVGEALAKAGLSHEHVTMESPDKRRLLGPSEDLYSMTEPGEELHVSPHLNAGQ